MSGHPLLKPEYSFQGSANNEAETATFSNVARQQFNVDGTGVTVGVLSDSVNQYPTTGSGIPASVASGDLPSNPPVNVLQDGPAGSTDEGRAMLENIYDIAPGAGLAFATAGGSDLAMADNIKALANTAKSNIIVDDVGFADEPFFQDGIISQAVNTVVGQGVTYFSSARNESNHGYLSNFRGTTGTVGSLGSGTFQNFDGSGLSKTLELPITVNVANTNIIFQFDQPFNTQQPAGSPNVVTSQVNFYVLDSTGAIVASGTNDNTATQEPIQMLTVPSTGNYFVAIQVIKGPNPGHVEFMQFGQQSINDLIVPQTFGSAGGTFYPTTAGHNSAAATIGVGAVPWWAPAPYLSQSPLLSEPFSSAGPSITVRNPDGSLMTNPVTVQNPAITAPDGGNTSFFEPGNIINTSNNPPFVPGQPSTPTNLSQALPSFFGTSSAAPNAAAVAALMKQRVPTATPADIRAGLIASGTPMNGTPKGVWDPTAGFGNINAIKAINAVNVLRVASTNPANGSVVTVTPGAISVTFNKPINFATVTADPNPADILTFVTTPPGVTVILGKPIPVGDPNFPTTIQFPFSFSKPVGTVANGNYTFTVQNPPSPFGPITSKDGKALVPGAPISFTLNDKTAPEVASTSIFSRQITITFTKAIDPATITLANFYVQRTGGTPFVNPPTPTSNINLNSDPRAKISSVLNSAGQTVVTLDYSGLPQTEMPSDNYRIVINSAAVTDLVGNELDGAFSGSFPSGDGMPGSTFIQDLGLQTLQAPVLTTFQMTAQTDTGIPGDQNTRVTQPVFIGQVFNSFPGTVANLQVLVEFNGLHPELGGGFDLNVGGGGRGFVGTFDVAVTTDNTGKFTVTAPPLPAGLPAGPGRGDRPGRSAPASRLLLGPGARLPDRPVASDHYPGFAGE